MGRGGLNSLFSQVETHSRADRLTFVDDLLAIALGKRTLEDVVRWTLLRGDELVEVVGQDEYTLDVVVRANVTKGRSVFLVYDTT